MRPIRPGYDRERLQEPVPTSIHVLFTVAVEEIENIQEDGDVSRR